ncbi:MAG: hypothetical protein FWD53_10895, partial [Phycisphaerales bacterium]|nr:hypothetical protein [Phycisphaerales bacterium]
AGRQKRSWLYILAGIFAVFTFFAKGSGILLLGLYPIIAILTNPKRFRILIDKWFLAGLATAFLCLAPYFFNNLRDGGHLFRSTQNYVTSFFGIVPTSHWDKTMYYPYWDGHGRALPKISDRWRNHPEYRQRSRQQLVTALQYVLTGGSGSGDIARDFGEKGVKIRDFLAPPSPPSLQTEADAAPRRTRNRRTPPPPATIKPINEWCAPIWTIIGGMGFMLIATATAWAAVELIKKQLRAIRARRASNTRPKRQTATPDWVGRVLSVALVGIVYGTFIAYFWWVASRFCFPMLPLILALGCTFGVMLIEGPAIVLWRFFKSKKMRRIALIAHAWPIGATILAGAIILLSQNRLLGIEKQLLDREGARPPTARSFENQYITLGHWLKKEHPEAIVMCRNPWELLFYCSPTNKAVALPYPDDDDPRAAEKIFAIARYYHVTYMYADVKRSCMWPYFYGSKPGLTRVQNGPGDLYKIDWTTAPTATVDDVFRRN